jgi:hypothetical protein
VKKIYQQDMHRWYMSMWDDLVYNRQRFINSQDKYQKLDAFVKSIL